MDLARELRENNPARVVVFDGDGEKRELKVQAKRRKWEAITTLVDKLATTEAGVNRVEMLDRDGAVVNVWLPESPAEADPMQGAPPDVKRAEYIAELILRAQDMALKRVEAQLGTLLKGYQELAQVQSERLVSLERVHGQYLDIARRAVNEARRSEEAAEGSQADGMMAQVLPMVMQQLSAPKAGAK
jgi:hypothetical protein